MQHDTNRKERVSGMAGLFGMADCYEGRRKQKAQLKWRWKRELEKVLIERENPNPQDAQ